MKTAIPVVMVLVLTLALAPASVLFARASAGAGPVVVIVPPWRDPARIVARAGGGLVGPVEAPMAVLASFDGPVDRAELRRLGAWAVLDAGLLADLCGDGNAEKK